MLDSFTLTFTIRIMITISKRNSFPENSVLNKYEQNKKFISSICVETYPLHEFKKTKDGVKYKKYNEQAAKEREKFLCIILDEINKAETHMKNMEDGEYAKKYNEWEEEEEKQLNDWLNKEYWEVMRMKYPGEYE